MEGITPCVSAQSPGGRVHLAIQKLDLANHLATDLSVLASLNLHECRYRILVEE
jgi:hypothetical protein